MYLYVVIMEKRRNLLMSMTSLLCIWSALAEEQLVGLHSAELSSGQLTIPRRVSPSGEFLTHNLTHHHEQQHQFNNYLDTKQNKNSNNITADLHYHLEVNNETLHLELQPHSYFLAPHLIVERHRRDLRARKKPTKNTKCHFHGKIRGQTESRVALSTCGGLVGHIKTRNNEYYIEPSKHHDAHPKNGHPHVVFHRSSVKEKKNKQRRHKNRSRNKKKHQEQQIHRYQYQHRQQQQQQQQQQHQHQHQHAVSNCGTKEPRRRTETRLEWQPQGKVKIQGGRKIRRHQLQQAQNAMRHQPQTKFKYETAEEVLVTGTHSKYSKQQQQQQQKQEHSENYNRQPTTMSYASSTRWSRSKRSISSPRHVETLIVADATMVAFHNDVETYLLTIMNMVSALYKDPSIGNAIEVVVVKIILLEEDEAHPDLNLTLNAQKNLDTFCGWQHKLNTANENDPQHHDVAILITRKNICGDNCMTLGLANVGGMCKPKKSCSVNEDNGIMLSHTIAHELGHNFGMFHDTAKIGCHPRVGPIVHIMTPTFGADTLQVCWSNCSRKFITHFLDQGLGDCLDDAPTPLVQYVYPEIPPGVMYNAELQCRLQFNVTDGDVGACSSMNEICSTLWCQVNGECVTNMRPTAPGTSCGKHKWCQNGNCVRMEEIVPVDGGWGSWSEWNECSRSCGGGISIQQRECDSPLPANGGVFCIGERKRYKICNKQPCDNADASFRAQQCSNFDEVPYQGAIYKWQPFFDKNHPCKLFCNDVDDTIIANWGDVVLDGTPCTLGTNNMCIDGICKKVGCDWSIDSDLEEDRCGICGGSGDKCKPVKEIFNEPFNVTEGYVEVVTIPSKARHILIKELGNTPHFLSIAKANSSIFYLNGESLISMPGEFIIAGAESMYDREDEQETISIPHPIEHSIALYAIVRGNEPNEGIYYEFTLPATLGQGRKQNYTWRLSDWTACSTSCGGGAQYREPLCYENERLTHEEELCWSNAQNVRPIKLVRRCNEHQCPAHWWVGPWQFCPVKCIEAGAVLPLKHRSVMCLDQHEIVVEDSVCNNATRPADTESCGQLPECKKTNNMKNVILLMQNL